MKSLNKPVKWVLTAALTLGGTGLLNRSAEAGALPGPKQATSDVAAYDTDSYTVRFAADEVAIVTIHGDRDTVLNAYVIDGNGNQIVSDTDGDGTGRIYLKWEPRWTGTFKIKIVNTGRVYNHYHLETN